MRKKSIDYSFWSKDELIAELKRIKETTYGLVWHRDFSNEKIDVLINPDARTPEEMFANEIAGKPFPVLNEIASKEVVSSKDNQTHLLIEGDNYHSLAVLNFTHQEAIDVIYIDPPYNTGNNDFIYTDNFQSSYVDKEDPFRHSKWLSFMEKRLKLAKNLLTKTGVMFISIDDNEQAQLRMLCAEIFGEDNFESMVWQKTDSRVDKNTNAKQINRTKRIHEYIFVIYNNKMSTRLNKIMKLPEWKNNGKNPDKDPRGPYEAGIISFMEGHEKEDKNSEYYYTIKLPSGREITRHFFVLKNEFEVLERDHRIYYPKKGDGVPRLKVFQNEEKEYYFESIIRGFGTSSSAKDEIEEIFGDRTLFDTPKPLKLIKEIVRSASNRNSIVLDFMAGSGTTGHAVLDLNNEDGGSRQFILCTNNENNIATDICQPRVQKAIKGYVNNLGEKIEGLDGNLKYYSAYDFVESEPTDKNKRKLVKKSTEMICIKEGVYDLVVETEEFKILKNAQDKYLGIIFYEDAISSYKKEVKKINNVVITYVFSLGDDPHRAEFEDVIDLVVLQPIPDVILRVYQEIFK